MIIQMFHIIIINNQRKHIPWGAMLIILNHIFIYLVSMTKVVGGHVSLEDRMELKSYGSICLI
jgi:hypothetical protein